MIEKNEVKDKKEIFEEKQQELFDRFFTLKKEISKTKKETEKYEELLDLLNYTAGNIIESNKGLIIKIVHKRMVDGVEFDDLVQEGKKAMYEALLRYDRKKDSKFSTYVYQYVDGSLQNYIIDYAKTIRVPWLAKENFRVYSKCLYDFYVMNHRYPLDQEIIDFMNSSNETKYMPYKDKSKKALWNKERLKNMKMIADQSYLPSVNDPVDSDNDAELFEVIEDKSIKRPDVIAMNNFEVEKRRLDMNNIFNEFSEMTLDNRMIDILKLRHGVYDDNLKVIISKTINRVGIEKFGEVIANEPLTLEQISYIYGITRENARVLSDIGIRQLQILAGTNPEIEIKEEHRFPFLTRDLDIRPKQLKDVEFVDYDSDIININSKNAYISAKKQGETDLVILDHINDREITYHIKVTPKYKDNEYNRKKAKKLALRKEAKHE